MPSSRETIENSRAARGFWSNPLGADKPAIGPGRVLYSICHGPFQTLPSKHISLSLSLSLALRQRTQSSDQSTLAFNRQDGEENKRSNMRKLCAGTIVVWVKNIEIFFEKSLELPHWFFQFTTDWNALLLAWSLKNLNWNPLNCGHFKGWGKCPLKNWFGS